jgi:hypothetical protein
MAFSFEFDQICLAELAEEQFARCAQSGWRGMENKMQPKLSSDGNFFKAL